MPGGFRNDGRMFESVAIQTKKLAVPGVLVGTEFFWGRITRLDKDVMLGMENNIRTR
jgi:hypothetical protein